MNEYEEAAPRAFADAAEDETRAYPIEVRERLRIVDETARQNMDAINARLMPHLKEWGKRLSLILDSRPASAKHKFGALYRLADEMMSYNRENVACRRGCSHCCHTPVGMTDAEARVMGKAIGVAPMGAKPGRMDFSDLTPLADYDYPCPFLRDGECSIYAHRPLACRVHYNVDADALLCVLRPPLSIPVPYLNNQPFMLAAVQISAQVNGGKVPALGDIREFFPRGQAK